MQEQFKNEKQEKIYTAFLLIFLYFLSITIIISPEGVYGYKNIFYYGASSQYESFKYNHHSIFDLIIGFIYIAFIAFYVFSFKKTSKYLFIFAFLFTSLKYSLDYLIYSNTFRNYSISYLVVLLFLLLSFWGYKILYTNDKRNQIAYVKNKASSIISNYKKK